MKRKDILFSVCIAITIILIIIGLLAGIYRRAHKSKIPTQIDPEMPIVALTFDDGPNPN